MFTGQVLRNESTHSSTRVTMAPWCRLLYQPTWFSRSGSSSVLVIFPTKTWKKDGNRWTICVP